MGRADQYHENGDDVPSSARIKINSNQMIPWFWDSDISNIQADEIDGQSVIDHEICHAIGFTTGYTLFESQLEAEDGYMIFFYRDSDDIAFLVPEDEGAHTSPIFHPNDFMNPILHEATRREPSELGIGMLNNCIYDLIPGKHGSLVDARGGADINADGMLDNYFIWARPFWFISGWETIVSVKNVGTIAGNFIIEGNIGSQWWHLQRPNDFFENTQEIELEPGESGEVSFIIDNPNFENDVTFYWEMFYDGFFSNPLVDQGTQYPYSRHCLIQSPRTDDPAFAGLYNSPQEITVFCYTEHELLQNELQFDIGGLDASITSIQEVGLCYYSINLQPPVL